jgi:hypothetical protein
MILVHGVRVHDPRHHALVRVHVRRRDVRIGAQRVDDACRIPPRQALELSGTHAQRITDDAAFRTAERHVDHGALPCHPGRQRRHLIERHVQVEPDTSFRRATGRVVEHANPREHLDFSIVHHRWTGHDDLLFRLSQNLVEAGFEIEQVRGPVEPRHHRLEWILLMQEAVLVGSDDGVRREA